MGAFFGDHFYRRDFTGRGLDLVQCACGERNKCLMSTRIDCLHLACHVELNPGPVHVTHLQFKGRILSALYLSLTLTTQIEGVRILWRHEYKLPGQYDPL